jgi:hypothetical protein
VIGGWRRHCPWWAWIEERPWRLRAFYALNVVGSVGLTVWGIYEW